MASANRGRPRDWFAGLCKDAEKNYAVSIVGLYVVENTLD